MKKYISLFLAAVILLSFTACGRKNKENANPTTPPTNVQMELPDSALALLQTVWTSYGENDQFPAMGGSYNEDESKNNHVDNGPGKYDLADDGLMSKLMVPEAEKGKIAEAASLTHGMMLNNFTCGAYKMAAGADAKVFGQAMYKSITEQRFLCGSPEAILVVTLGNDYVVAAFGLNELMGTLKNKIVAAYPGAQVLYNQLIPA